MAPAKETPRKARSPSPPSRRAAPKPKPESAATREVPFVRCEVTPLGDPKLAFSLVVPRDWKPLRRFVTPETLAQDAREFIPLGAFACPDGSSLIEVRYLRVPVHISLSRFAAAYVQNAGLLPLARRRLELAGRQWEDLVLRGKEQPPRLMRWSASRHGELIFIVASSSPEAEFEQRVEAFTAAAASFRPLQGSPLEQSLSLPKVAKTAFDAAGLAAKLEGKD
jgi:hypothetical protein